MFKHLLLSACLINLASCATIIEGGSQSINVSTDPAVPSACTLSNGRGSWGSAYTPSTIIVERSQTRLDVICHSQTHTGELSHQATAEAWTFGNILLGGLIGLSIDAFTGSMFAYDDALTVPMVAKGGKVMLDAPGDAAPVVTPLTRTEPLMMEERIPAAAPVNQPPAEQTLPSSSPNGRFVPQIAPPSRAPQLPPSQF